jgi:hypothetical protein
MGAKEAGDDPFGENSEYRIQNPEVGRYSEVGQIAPQAPVRRRSTDQHRVTFDDVGWASRPTGNGDHLPLPFDPPIFWILNSIFWIPSEDRLLPPLSAGLHATAKPDTTACWYAYPGY